jgi:hypothetical protein
MTDPTPARPCSRCQAEPAEPGQRWGRNCRNASKRNRRAWAKLELEWRRRCMVGLPVPEFKVDDVPRRTVDEGDKTGQGTD